MLDVGIVDASQLLTSVLPQQCRQPRKAVINGFDFLSLNLHA
jgi:hypothetical protein